MKELLGAASRVIELPLPEPNRPTIDFLFGLRHADGQAVRVADVIVGPYRNPDTYTKRRQEEVLRALGMAWMFDHVVLLLPAAGDLAEYRHLLAEYVDATSGHTEAIDGHARGPKVYIILIDEL